MLCGSMLEVPFSVCDLVLRDLGSFGPAFLRSLAIIYRT